MDNYKEIWQETVDQIKLSVPKTASYFASSSYLKTEGNVLYVSTTSSFMKANILQIKDLIVNTFSEKAGENFTLEIVVDNSLKPERSEKNNKKQEDIQVKKEKQSKNTTLNKKYSFDNFVYGENSDFAYKAAKVIALNPGISYNPCLIYGGVGLGKTHLLQAIGNYIDEHNPTLKVIYVTAESFTNEFISCFSAGDSNKEKSRFKEKYRNADVLLIDDIHFFQKKEGIQEELFHTFNALYENNKQIVFTCDRPIKDLTDITERLRSRFSKGLNVDLRPPQYEIRMAIAKQKCKELNLKNIPSETLDYICQSVNTNVRDLEGALTTVSAAASLIEKPATIEMAKEYLKDIIIEPVLKPTEYTIEDIFKATSNYFNISLVDLKGNSRSKSIKIPRQIAIYFSYKYGKFTQTEIGSFLNKDHTSIGYTIKTMEPLVDMDDSIKHAIEEIKEKLEEK